MLPCSEHGTASDIAEARAYRARLPRCFAEGCGEPRSPGGVYGGVYCHEHGEHFRGACRPFDCAICLACEARDEHDLENEGATCDACEWGVF